MLAFAAAVAAALLGFSLPLDYWQGQPPPLLPRRWSNFHQRAPLAEHGWERRVLRNLTRSE